MSLDRLFLTILVASLLSFGGLGSLPLLRGELAAAHLTPDPLILRSLAVGNIGPGPNGLYLVAIGYFVSGPLGTLVATAALLLPPLLVLVLERARARLMHRPRFQAALTSLSFAVVALLATTSGGLAFRSARTPLEAALVVIAAAALLRSVPPVVTVVAVIALGLIIG